MRKAGIKTARIATEFGFLPFDASKTLRAAIKTAAVFSGGRWGSASK